jgi:hypothetical protein
MSIICLTIILHSLEDWFFGGRYNCISFFVLDYATRTALKLYLSLFLSISPFLLADDAAPFLYYNSEDHAQAHKKRPHSRAAFW